MDSCHPVENPEPPGLGVVLPGTPPLSVLPPSSSSSYSAASVSTRRTSSSPAVLPATSLRRATSVFPLVSAASPPAPLHNRHRPPHTWPWRYPQPPPLPLSSCVRDWPSPLPPLLRRRTKPRSNAHHGRPPSLLFVRPRPPLPTSSSYLSCAGRRLWRMRVKGPGRRERVGRDGTRLVYSTSAGGGGGGGGGNSVPYL